jgi:hypothetical protein
LLFVKHRNKWPQQQRHPSVQGVVELANCQYNATGGWPSIHTLQFFQQETYITNSDACYFMTNNADVTCHNLRKWCHLLEHHLCKHHIGTLQDNVCCLCILLANLHTSRLRCFEILAPQTSC